MSVATSYLYKSALSALLLLAVACSTDNATTVAWVNQYPISDTELEHWMLLQRAEVHNYFYEKYETIDSDDFWETEIEGESPLDLLKELALNKAVRYKTQQILALEKGLNVQIDFDQMILEMQKENQLRKEKIENGEVVYGASKYTTRTFFAHEFDKMIIQLKPMLLKDELKPSEKDLLALVKNEDFPLEENYGFYQLQYVEENYDHFIDSLVSTVEIEISKKNWNAIDAFFN